MLPWVCLVSDKWFSFESLVLMLCLNKSINALVKKLVSVEEKREERALILEQLSLLWSLDVRDGSILKAILGLDRMSLDAVKNAANALVHNSVRFPYLVEICRHFRHRNLKSRETEMTHSNCLLFGREFYEFGLGKQMQCLKDFRELFEFMQANDLDKMKQVLERNGVNPEVFVKCLDVTEQRQGSEHPPRLGGTVSQINIFHCHVQYRKGGIEISYKIEIVVQWEKVSWYLFEKSSIGEMDLQHHSIKTLFGQFEAILGR